jgi:hypothetical protein
MVAAFGLARSVGVGASMFPPDDPRLLQGAPLPRLGLGHPRLPPRAGHLQDGRAGPDALTFWTFTIAVAAIVGPAGLAGLLLQGRDPRPRLRQEPGGVRRARFTAVLTAFLHAQALEDRVPRGPEERGGGARPRGRGLDHGAACPACALSSVGGYMWLYPGAFGGVFSQIPEAAGSAHAVILADEPGVLAVGAGSSLASTRRTAPTRLSSGRRRHSASFSRSGPALTAPTTITSRRSSSERRWPSISSTSSGWRASVVRGLAGAVEVVGFGVRALHTGRINNYVYWFLPASSSSGPLPPASSDSRDEQPFL